MDVLTTDEILLRVLFGVGVLALLIMLGIWGVNRYVERKESRLAVFKVSIIFRLRGEDDLAQQVMDAKNLQAVEKICRHYDEGRKERPDGSDCRPPL